MQSDQRDQRKNSTYHSGNPDHLHQLRTPSTRRVRFESDLAEGERTSVAASKPPISSNGIDYINSTDPFYYSNSEIPQLEFQYEDEEESNLRFPSNRQPRSTPGNRQSNSNQNYLQDKTKQLEHLKQQMQNNSWTLQDPENSGSWRQPYDSNNRIAVPSAPEGRATAKFSNHNHNSAPNSRNEFYRDPFDLQYSQASSGMERNFTQLGNVNYNSYLEDDLSMSQAVELDISN